MREFNPDVAPPHDEDLEACVLGAVLIAQPWLDQLVVDVQLTAIDFYRPRHRLIYQAMLDLVNDNEGVDTGTVAHRLAERNKLEEAGGKDYIETIVTRIPAIGNTKQYALAIKELSQVRQMLAALQMGISAIDNRDADPPALLEQIQQSVFDVVQGEGTGKVREISGVLLDAVERMEQMAMSGSSLTGVSTGFRDLDELTGGLQPGNLIVVAARPSMGKSALVTNIAEHAALSGVPTALFSMEMSEQELSERFIASQAKISGDDLRRGRIEAKDWPRVLNAAQEFDGAPMFIDESAELSVAELRAKARRLNGQVQAKHGRGLGLIIVDYLQLMRPADSSVGRVEQVGQMSRGLKILARELNVPVVAISQLSRAVESRNPPRPQLSDLRDSGSIEQDADLVAFIYRDDYYNRDDSSKPGIADLIIAKHRNGRIGDIELTFIAHYPKFANKPREYKPAGGAGEVGF